MSLFSCFNNMCLSITELLDSVANISRCSNPLSYPDLDVSPTYIGVCIFSSSCFLSSKLTPVSSSILLVYLFACLLVCLFACFLVCFVACLLVCLFVCLLVGLLASLIVLLLPSSVKPQQQPQLPAAAKLAELQPYFAIHPPPLPCQ